MSWLYSIYVFFLVAVIVRYVWLLSELFRGRGLEESDPTKVTSAL
jgi:hypothetical protein